MWLATGTVWIKVTKYNIFIMLGKSTHFSPRRNLLTVEWAQGTSPISQRHRFNSLQMLTVSSDISISGFVWRDSTCACERHRSASTGPMLKHNSTWMEIKNIKQKKSTGSSSFSFPVTYSTCHLFQAFGSHLCQRSGAEMCLAQHQRGIGSDFRQDLLRPQAKPSAWFCPAVWS